MASDTPPVSTREDAKSQPSTKLDPSAAVTPPVSAAVDPKSQPSTKLDDMAAVTPSTTKDATGIFIALASFALAESTALTVVARDDDKQLLVLIIYGVAVVFTIAWIVLMLVSGRTSSATPFDATSIRYGRMTLAWNVILAGLMVVLAFNRLLPNQTARAYLSQKSIPVSLAFDGDRVLEQLEKDEGIRLTGFESWIALCDRPFSGDIQKQTPQAGKEVKAKTIVWLKQIQNFDAHFRSKRYRVALDGDISFDPESCGEEVAQGTGNKQADDSKTVRLLRRAAFLVRVNPKSGNPEYRQLPFTEYGDALGCDFLLVDPNPRERLLVVIELEHVPSVDPKKLNLQIKELER